MTAMEEVVTAVVVAEWCWRRRRRSPLAGSWRGVGHSSTRPRSPRWHPLPTWWPHSQHRCRPSPCSQRRRCHRRHSPSIRNRCSHRSRTPGFDRWSSVCGGSPSSWLYLPRGTSRRSASRPSRSFHSAWHLCVHLFGQYRPGPRSHTCTCWIRHQMPGSRSRDMHTRCSRGSCTPDSSWWSRRSRCRYG